MPSKEHFLEYIEIGGTAACLVFNTLINKAQVMPIVSCFRNLHVQ